MSDHQHLGNPHFVLTRVFADGSQEPPQIVPVSALSMDTKMPRRGFLATTCLLGAGVSASMISMARAATMNTETSQECGSGSHAHTADVNCLAFSPNGRWLASGSDDETIKLWAMPEGALKRVIKGHTDDVGALAFSPDGRRLASASDDKTIKLWAMPAGTLERTLEGHTGIVSALAFSPDGRWVASGSWDNTIKLWAIPEGTLKRTMEGHTNLISGLTFTSDGRWLVSVSWDKTIRVWNIPEGTLNRTIEEETKQSAVASSPDGSWLATGSWEAEIKLWAMPDCELRRTLGGRGGAVHAIAFSPDSRLLASVSWHDPVKLWAVPDGALSRTLGEHMGRVDTVAFSPDGHWLVAGSDENVMLWAMPEGTLETCLPRRIAPASPPSKRSAPVSPPPPKPSAPVAPSPERSAPGSPPVGGSYRYCTCDKVCVCIPVCQAHRLLDPDPTVRQMAEQLLLIMGYRELRYMRWAAQEARGSLRARILRFIIAIQDGAASTPFRWPSFSRCLRYLSDSDEVTRIMAAQFIRLHQQIHGTPPLPAIVEQEVYRLLDSARSNPWYVRYKVSTAAYRKS